MDIILNDAGKEIINQDGIRIVAKYVDEDTFWGKSILLYLENSSEKNIHISVDNMSINGFMVEPLFSTEIYSGKKSLFAPLSSFKPKHKKMSESVDFVKIKDYSVININNMIPVPEGCYHLVDVNGEKAPQYFLKYQRDFLFVSMKKVMNNKSRLIKIRFPY